MPPRSSTTARLLVDLTLAPILFLACRSGGEPAPAPSAVPSPPTLPASASIAAPPASARVSPTLADLQKRATTAPAWPSGPGVACGEARCKAGELCCDGGEKRCLPKSRVKECLDARSAAIECDESSDCGTGQICCYGILYEKEAQHISCKTPAVCARPLSRPGSLPFPGRELCARGGTCRDPRLVCVNDDSMPSGGKCISNVGSVVCTGDQACPTDRPWCLWDPGTRTAECIPRGPWEREDGVYPCDGSEDCVGEPCCTAGSKSFCAMDCTEAFRFASEVCHRDSDCTAPDEVSAGQRLIWRCEPAEGGLPGLKQCSQAVPTPP